LAFQSYIEGSATLQYLILNTLFGKKH